MGLRHGLKTWWQRATGEAETPFDGDAPVFVVSVLLHMAVLVVLAVWPMTLPPTTPIPEVVAIAEPAEEPEMELPQMVAFSEQSQDDIGANSENGEMMALSLASAIAESSEIPREADLAITDMGQIEVNNMLFEPTALHASPNMVVKGAAGVGETGASGAVDRLTHEILASMEERPTLVVWLFDQSGSLNRQRSEILDRFNKIYEELGVIEAAGNESFTKHDEKPLLTSVVAFGNEVSLMTKEPTDSLAEIKDAVKSIKEDESGVERVFSAVYMAASQFKKYRVPDDRTGQPDRNVMFVVFSDEVGDDTEGLDKTVNICTRYRIPVYVVGVPAPFGRDEVFVKWVDPIESNDQSPQWAPVRQGPETFLPERVKLAFGGSDEEQETPIDSGFGPYALTRLCVQTGGIYFTVHPNRNVNRMVSRGETEAFSAYLGQFFDPRVMRRYQPDYVSADEYRRKVSASKARSALVQASQLSWIAKMEDPRTVFPRTDEAVFNQILTEAQKSAAALEPKINTLYEMVKLGEADRPKEASERWQAGYDLAMGRTLAAKVRTETYNAMLAEAKRGLKSDDPRTNRWTLKPADEITVGSQWDKMRIKAKEYLERVVADHEGTPWAYLAAQDLETPIGWKWVGTYVPPPPPRPAMAPGANNNAPMPADDKAMMLEKMPTRRKPPNL